MAGKQSTEGTFARRVAILRLLAAARSGPDGLSVSEIVERLPKEDFPVNARTVQRDLVALSDKGSEWSKAGIRVEGRIAPLDKRSLLWRHAPASKALLFQTMTEEEATVLTLLKQELEPLIPLSVSAAISHYFVEADRLLSGNGRAKGRQFKNKIRVIPDGVQQIAPSIRAEHIQQVTEALFRKEQIDIVYAAAKHGHRQKLYRLHPIGLVKQGVFYYVVAGTEESIQTDQPVQSFRIDRFRKVTRRHSDPISTKLPTLNEALRQGVTQFVFARLINLQIHIANVGTSNLTVAKFRDAPLSHDQQIVENADGSHTLSATVHHSMALERLLQGLSHQIDVIRPDKLRDRIDACLESAMQLRRATR